MNIKLQLDGLTRVKTMLGDDTARRIVYQTLNKLTLQAAAETRRQIRQEYNVKNKDLKSHMVVIRANQYHLSTSIKLSGRRLQLSQFSPRQTKRGVSVAIKRGMRKILPHRFLAHMRYGYNVFERLSTKRFPVKGLLTISLPEMFGSKKIITAVEQHILSKVDAIYKSQLAYNLERLARKK